MVKLKIKPREPHLLIKRNKTADASRNRQWSLFLRAALRLFLQRRVDDQLHGERLALASGLFAVGPELFVESNRLRRVQQKTSRSIDDHFSVKKASAGPISVARGHASLGRSLKDGLNF